MIQWSEEASLTVNKAIERGSVELPFCPKMFVGSIAFVEVPYIEQIIHMLHMITIDELDALIVILERLSTNDSTCRELHRFATKISFSRWGVP